MRHSLIVILATNILACGGDPMNPPAGVGGDDDTIIDVEVPEDVQVIEPARVDAVADVDSLEPTAVHEHTVDAQEIIEPSVIEAVAPPPEWRITSSSMQAVRIADCLTDSEYTGWHCDPGEAWRAPQIAVARSDSASGSVMLLDETGGSKQGRMVRVDAVELVLTGGLACVNERTEVLQIDIYECL